MLCELLSSNRMDMWTVRLQITRWYHEEGHGYKVKWRKEWDAVNHLSNEGVSEAIGQRWHS